MSNTDDAAKLGDVEDGSDTGSEDKSHNDSGQDSQDSDPQGDGPNPPSALVWSVRLIALAGLAAIMVFLTYEILRGDTTVTFDASADYDRVERRDDAYVLPVEIENTSNASVTQVVAEVETRGNGQSYTRTLSIALMGQGESVMAEIRVPDRPTPDNTRVRVVSYQSP